MAICPMCGPGLGHNDEKCTECMNNLKNWIRGPEPIPKPDQKETYIVNQLVKDLLFEAIIKDDISSSSTALHAAKEMYGSALKEQFEYGKQLADEAAAQLDKLGVKY